MKLRKPLAFLLTLALLLGAPPIVGASGAVDEPSTTFESVGIITQADTPETSKIIHVIDNTINVTIKNAECKIQVNPYGMSIDDPYNSDTSTESIVSVPLYLENHTKLNVAVTAKATAVPYGNVVLDDKPTRYVYEHSPNETPDEVPNPERVYLYLQMQEQTKDMLGAKMDLDSLPKKVITKIGGSDEITVVMPADGGAALKIGGNTSIPPSLGGAWHNKDGFDVNILLSFMPKQEKGYDVNFAVEDIWGNEGEDLKFPVTITLQGETEEDKDGNTTLTFDKCNVAQKVKAKESLTFTVDTAEEKKGTFYYITAIYLTHLKNGVPIEDSEEYLYQDNEDDELITFTETVNASKVSLEETLQISVVVNSITYPS